MNKLLELLDKLLEKKRRVVDTILFVLTIGSLCVFVNFVVIYGNIQPIIKWLQIPYEWLHVPYEWLHKEKTPLLIISSVLSVILLIIGSLRKSHSDDLMAFLHPFFHGKKGVVYGITATVICTIVVAILAHLYHFINIKFFEFAPFILCIVGIYVTSRVYFEIQEDKTVTLEDYMKNLNYIISSSREKDKILIIAPTIILGQSHKTHKIDGNKDKDKRYIHIIDTYFDQIMKHLEIGEIYFALLDFDYKNFKEIEVHSEGNKKAWYKILDMCGNDIGRKPLSNYHFESYCQGAYDHDNLQRYMAEFGSKLKKLIHTGKANFIRLDSKMYIDGDNYAQGRGFFAVANFDNGMYYLGAYEHYNRTYNFHGTYFRNEHIKTQMLNMLNIIINDKIVSETSDEKEKREKFFRDDTGTTH